MKVAVVFLVLLGVLAAGAAAVLVQTLPQLKNRAPATVSVLVAADDLEPRTLLTEKNVKVDKAPVVGLPAGHFSTPAQAIGKVLKVKMAKGEPLSAASCMVRNTVDDLLSPGMLAFTASLPRQTTPVDMLYPGCVVDVFATFPLRDKERGDAVVTPLLQNIRVLAIGTEKVVDEAQKEKSVTGKAPRASATGSVPVTLEVNARQAAALALVLEQGRLGLAMRSPTYTGLNPMEPMVVKEGQLTAGSEALDPASLAFLGKMQEMLTGVPAKIDANTPAPPKPPVAAAPAPEVKPVPMTAPADAVEPIGGFQRQKASWQVDVYHGNKLDPVDLQVDNEAEQPVEATPQEGGS